MSAFIPAHVATLYWRPLSQSFELLSPIPLFQSEQLLSISFRAGLEVPKLFQLCILWDCLNCAFILKERFSEYRFTWEFSPRPVGISPFSEYTGLYLMPAGPFKLPQLPSLFCCFSASSFSCLVLKVCELLPLCVQFSFQSPYFSLSRISLGLLYFLFIFSLCP